MLVQLNTFFIFLKKQGEKGYLLSLTQLPEQLEYRLPSEQDCMS